ncbi:uncharacterized protein LOC134215474 [Armigeres subalbatus]|uniref:uncharacterized protein LOC134215474 n=1 Tax=Armigeres subalbatus TaxID=124917 RepID=UPI002ED4DA93
MTVFTDVPDYKEGRPMATYGYSRIRTSIYAVTQPPTRFQPQDTPAGKSRSYRRGAADSGLPVIVKPSEACVSHRSSEVPGNRRQRHFRQQSATAERRPRLPVVGNRRETAKHGHARQSSATAEIPLNTCHARQSSAIAEIPLTRSTLASRRQPPK